MKVRQLHTTDTSRSMIFAGSRGVADIKDCVTIVFKGLSRYLSTDPLIITNMSYTLTYNAKDNRYEYHVKYQNGNTRSYYLAYDAEKDLWAFTWGASTLYKTTSHYRMIDYDLGIAEFVPQSDDEFIGPTNMMYYAYSRAQSLESIFFFNHSQFVDKDGNDLPINLDQSGININRQFAATYVDDIEGIRQHLIQHLSIIKHELWYNYLYGLPLGEKNVTKGMIDAEVLMIVTDCPGIVNVESFESVVDGNDYKLSISIQTKYGLLDINNTL